MNVFIHERERDQFTCDQTAGATVINKTAGLCNVSSGTVWNIVH